MRHGTTQPQSQEAGVVDIEAVERNGEAWKLEPVKDDGLPSREAYVEADEKC